MLGDDTYTFKVAVNFVYYNELAYSIMKKVELEKFIRKIVLITVVDVRHPDRYARSTIYGRLHKLRKLGLLEYVFDDAGITPMIALTDRGKEVMKAVEKLEDRW